jgi:hypothetical protein
MATQSPSLPGTLTNEQLVYETYTLIERYRLDPLFRNKLNRVLEVSKKPIVPELRRPLSLYMYVIAQVSPKFSFNPYAKEVKPSDLANLFSHYRVDQNGQRILETIIQTRKAAEVEALTPEELRVAQEAHDKPNDEEHHDIIDKLLHKKEEEHKSAGSPQHSAVSHPPQTSPSPLPAQSPTSLQPTDAPSTPLRTNQQAASNSRPFRGQVPQTATPKASSPDPGGQRVDISSGPWATIATPSPQPLQPTPTIFTPDSLSLEVTEEMVPETVEVALPQVDIESPPEEPERPWLDLPSTPHIPSIPEPIINTAKDVESAAERAVHRGVVKAPGLLNKGLKEGVNQLMGPRTVGGLLGQGGRAALAGQAASGLATGGVSTAITFLGFSAKHKKTIIIVGAAVLFLLFYVVLYQPLLKSSALLGIPGDQDPLGNTITMPQTQPNPNPQTSTELAACGFVRGGESSQPKQYKSQKLLGYITEAAAQANMPPALLAAFIRVESPSAVNFTDADVDNYTCTPQNTSVDGALGLMQIIPTFSHRTDAICKDCISNGARYFGKTADTLTKEDYCDVRKNIMIGTGFIIKKLEAYKYVNGGNWNDAWTDDKGAISSLVRGYYGCVRYPTCDSNGVGGGPFSYADDVFNSLQACKIAQTTPQPSPPTSTPNNLSQALIDQFGLNMSEFSERQQKWAWDKLSSVSNTNFVKLIHGRERLITVAKVDAGSHQESCKKIYVRDNNDEQTFNVVLFHELGHIIYHCNDEALARTREHTSVRAQEGSVTAYGQRDVTEDYPEMIAYYLNLSITERTNDARNIVPYANGRYPLHFNLARSILGKYP